MNERNEYAEHLSEAWAQGLDLLPDYMVGGVVRYVLHGIKPGSFLTAVIDGDLFMALRKADDTNQQSLPQYARFFWNYAPSECFGSVNKRSEWVKKGGVVGVEADT